MIYELLRGQLSSAIKGGLLVGQLKERTDILSRGISGLTVSLKGMVESSDAIVASMASQSSAVEEQAGAIEQMVRNIKQIADMTVKSNSLIKTSAARGKDADLRLAAIMEHAKRNVAIANELKSSMTEQDAGTTEMLKATHELLRITEEANKNIGAQKEAIVEFGTSMQALESISSRGI
jgi:methyl-accepting chemotaxis protein